MTPRNATENLSQERAPQAPPAAQSPPAAEQAAKSPAGSAIPRSDARDAAQTPTPIQLRRPGGRRTLMRCMGYLRPYWRHVTGAYLVLLINNGITLTLPLIIRFIIDDGIAGGSANLIWRGVSAMEKTTESGWSWTGIRAPA